MKCKWYVWYVEDDLLIASRLLGSSFVDFSRLIGYLGSFYLTHKKAYGFKLTSLTKTFAVAKNQKHALQASKHQNSLALTFRSETATDKMASKIRKAAGVSDE